jgi:inward rectifier potassium channel
MALHKRSANLQTLNNTGFGSNSSTSGGRFYNRDGTANVHKTGIPWWERLSAYHTMLAMPRWKFLLMIFVFFLSINLLFAFIYFFLGNNVLSLSPALTTAEKFGQCFFFSAQTFTTVGYGHIAPQSFVGSAVAAVEALLGLLSFALATGLLYGRFSKPQAYILFSNIAVIGSFKEITGLMFRMAPYKNNHLTDVDVRLTLAMRMMENGVRVNRFFNLPTEITHINALTLSWTINHPINEESPIYQWTVEELKENQTELLVFVRAFDEAFSNTVTARTSYTSDEMVMGAKFVPMYSSGEDDKTTVLRLDEINKIQKEL